MKIEVSKLKRMQYIANGNIMELGGDGLGNPISKKEEDTAIPDDLFIGGDGIYARKVSHTIVANNGSNCLTVRFGLNNRNIILSGGADKSLCVYQWESSSLVQQIFLAAPVSTTHAMMMVHTSSPSQP
jgi:hypothetical protein